MKTVAVYLVSAVLLWTSASSLAGNWNVPTNAKDLKNPVPRSADTHREGKQIFAERCASCHGADAGGDGKQDRVDYDLRDIVADLEDGELFWKITHGVGKMPSYAGSLSDHERWLMVNHLRLLKEERAAKGTAKSKG
jgi:mono/diheme cytochrome c family protein